MLTVGGTGVLLLFIEATKLRSERITFFLALLGLVVAGVFAALALKTPHVIMHGKVQVGGFAGILALIILSATALAMLISKTYFHRLHTERTELYSLMMFASVGMLLMSSALDLVLIFLGIELMSVCLYILAGFTRAKLSSNEAALKYFLLGAFATGFLLYGIALVYGTTGTTNLLLIQTRVTHMGANLMFYLGLTLILVAFAFKVAAVPFHMWAPDVYEGAPTTITAFMATAAKTAAFGMIITVFMRTLNVGGSTLALTIGIIAALSMALGNFVAIAQKNIKRMLAYSSIAHAGYMLVGVASGNIIGMIGVVYYLAAYTAMNMGAFAIVAALEAKEDKKLSLDDYAGLSVKHPVLAALMALFMFALTGIPPFAGFVGKYYVFLAAVHSNMIWLAIVGVLASAVSAYFYLRIVVLMYFKEGDATFDEKPSLGVKVALTIAAVCVIGLGIYPSLIIGLIGILF
jgi:NADH-quinone oxidoreductase subunit N